MTDKSHQRKKCPAGLGCGKTKSKKKFSRNRKRVDGHCVYCSDCTRRMSQNYRDRLRLTLGRTFIKYRYVPMGFTREQIIKNIIRTPHNQEEIINLSGFDEDVVGKTLADLYDKGIARVNRTTRRFELKENSSMVQTSVAA